MTVIKSCWICEPPFQPGLWFLCFLLIHRGSYIFTNGNANPLYSIISQLPISFNNLLFLILNIYLWRIRLQIFLIEQTVGFTAVYNSRLACRSLWVSGHWDLPNFNTDQFSVTSSTNTTTARNWEMEATQRHCSGRAISCCMVPCPSSVCRLFTKWMEVTAFTHEEQMQIYLGSNIEQLTWCGSPYCKLCEMLTTLKKYKIDTSQNFIRAAGLNYYKA
jgi:hypothetical protein